MATNKTDSLTDSVKIPDGFQVQFMNSQLIVSHKGLTIKRTLETRQISISVEKGELKIYGKKDGKRTRRMAGTVKAHFKNMLKGVENPHIYKLKICSGHFPMNVSVSGNQIIIKNFLGESVPRSTTVPEGVNVQISGADVIAESADKELVGRFAGKLENLTRVLGRDLRVFQDGIYIVEKDGKGI